VLTTRIIPVLLLHSGCLVKTIHYKKYTYVGDPTNTVRIFNELEVDELFFLDISATRMKHAPDFSLLAEIAEECFMPLGYGGGIQSLDQAARVLEIGFEKIVLNTHALCDPTLISRAAARFGRQAVVVSVDVKNNIFWQPRVWSHGGTRNCHRTPLAWAREIEERGAGEVLLTDIKREGTWSGFNLELLREISAALSIPVIAHGGAGHPNHILEAVQIGGASAVALGSMVVFQKKGMGVLVHRPEIDVGTPS